jgi:hypothetical protein
VSFRNNVDAPPAENVHNQINNNDNHHVADDPQPVGVPPNIPGDGREEAPGGGENSSQNNVPMILLVTSSLKMQIIMHSYSIWLLMRISVIKPIIMIMVM